MSSELAPCGQILLDLSNNWYWSPLSILCWLRSLSGYQRCCDTAPGSSLRIVVLILPANESMVANSIQLRLSPRILLGQRERPLPRLWPSLEAVLIQWLTDRTTLRGHICSRDWTSWVLCDTCYRVQFHHLPHPIAPHLSQVVLLRSIFNKSSACKSPIFNLFPGNLTYDYSWC